MQKRKAVGQTHDPVHVLLRETPPNVGRFADDMSRGLVPKLGQAVRSAISGLFDPDKGDFFDFQYEDAIRGFAGFIQMRSRGDIDGIVGMNEASFSSRSGQYTKKQGDSAIKNQDAINRIVAGSISASFPSKAVILDAGCADGLRASKVREMLTVGGIQAKTFGVDMSSDMVALAAQRLDGAKVGDLRSLPYDGQRFDAITCLDGTLGHLKAKGRVKALASMHERLAPGGLLAIDLFNQEGYFSVKTDKMEGVRKAFQPVLKSIGEGDLGRGDYIYFVKGSKDPCFIHHFTDDGARSEIRGAGLKIEGAHTIGMGSYGGKDFGGHVDEGFNKASLLFIARKPR